MPILPGMTRDRAERLLDLIEAESQLEESQFKGLQISSAPFTETDVRNGRDIFHGVQSLEAGGTACIACHSIQDVSTSGPTYAEMKISETPSFRRSAEVDSARISQTCTSDCRAAIR